MIPPKEIGEDAVFHVEPACLDLPQHKIIRSDDGSHLVVVVQQGERKPNIHR